MVDIAILSRTNRVQMELQENWIEDINQDAAYYKIPLATEHRSIAFMRRIFRMFYLFQDVLAKTVPKKTTHADIRLLLVVEVFCLSYRSVGLAPQASNDFGFDGRFIFFLLLLVSIIFESIVFEILLLLFLFFLVSLGCWFGFLGGEFDRF